MKVKLDLAALKAAADRPDSSHAVVSRRWLSDIYLAISGKAEVELVPGQTPSAGEGLAM